MDDPINTCAVIPTGIVTAHATLATSLTGATNATPQTRASLTQATPTAQHRGLSQEKPSYAQDLQPPHKPHHSKTVTIQDPPSDSSSDYDSD